MTSTATLVDRQRMMRERNGSQNGSPPKPETLSPAGEQHYTPADVGKLWGFSAQSMIQLFENEPGVVVLGSPTPRPGKKRRRMFLRIPLSVMERKHRELVNK